MKKVVIIVGGFCYNRGSEAIVRGCAAILKKNIDECKIVLSSAEEEFGDQFRIKNIDKCVRRLSYGSTFSFNRLFSNIMRKVFKKDDIADRIKYHNLLMECKDADLVIVTGGDNYDTSYHMFEMMHSLNKAIRSITKGKMLMYDCSLDKNEINENVIKDFSLFDAVSAREDMTYSAFTDIFPKEKLFKHPDPAFVMEPAMVTLPDSWVNGKMIGINVSSMVADQQYGGGEQAILDAYSHMIQRIFDKTDYYIAFIPHVMKRLDLIMLEKLYEVFKHTERVLLINNEQYNAEQLKYIISKCNLYIGARTHSTIAAYSSCVPTLVLGYSIKSIGIAKDLFGTEKGYVVSVKNLVSASELADAFEKMLEHPEGIKKHLEDTMPQYIDDAWNSGEMFLKLLSN